MSQTFRMPMRDAIEKIKELYGLDDSVRCLSRIRKGYLSSNFIIGDSDRKYFLKKYSSNEERVRGAHRAKRFFSDGGIPVIMPLETWNGDTFFCQEGRCCALFPYIEGRQFRRLGMSKAALESAGEILARIHMLSESGEPDLAVREKRFLLDKSGTMERLEAVRNVIMAKSTTTEVDEAALELIVAKEKIVKENDREAESFDLGKPHLVHGDFHEANIFFDDSGTVSQVFDWECAGRMPRVLEIARALSLMCFNGRFVDRNYRNASVFLGAYLEKYPMRENELAEGMKAQFLSQSHSCWNLEEYYLRGNRKVFRFLHDELETLGFLAGNADEHIANVIGRLAMFQGVRH